MRLKELTIAGFRGFKLAQTIPLDGSIVVIHGSNGSGKSSIAEALEWLFFGDISRHARARNLSEFVGGYLRNVHCGERDQTFVKARVVLNDRELTISRDYQSQRRPSRILIDGKDADDFSALGISIEWNTKPILSQGELKGFVEAEQKDRYEEIAYILGLDILGQFRQSLMDLRNNVSKNPIIREALRLKDARVGDLTQYEEFRSLCQEIEASPYGHQGFLSKLYSCVQAVSKVKVRSLSQCQKALKAESERIIKTSPALSKLNQLRIPGDVIPTSEVLESLQEVASFCERLKPIAAQRLEMRQARFLKDGLELVSNSTCPFCLQQTVTEARKNEIQAKLEINEEGLRIEDELSKSLQDFSSRWLTVFQDLQARVEIKAGLKAALDEATAVLGATPDTAALRKLHDRKLPKAQKQVNKVNDEVQQLLQSGNNLLNNQPGLSIEELLKVANEIRREIEKTCVKVYRGNTELATLKSRMLSSTPGMPPGTRENIRMIIALESLVENAEHIKLAGICGNMSLGLENLQSKVEEFERARMKQMLVDLSDEISRYYDKLNPGEPIKFTRLHITAPAQRHVRIAGESFGKDLNPVSCFSEAHVNCLGLSLYFCQRVSRNPQWQFFVLDDPIQSMDEQHADRLVDILREISRGKQLIVLTQQKAFCDVLDDVFQGQSYIKYSCGPYSQDGPQIEPEMGSIETNLQLARAFSRGTKDDRINKSAGSLRKAMEAILKDLLVAKCGVTRTSLRAERVRLTRRLRQLESSGFDKDDIVDMRTILPIVDKPHHDDPNWDIHPQKIKRAVEILEGLCKRHKIGPYQSARTIVGRVVNYLPKVGVAVVEVEKPFSTGEDLMIEGTTTCIQMPVESIELDRKKTTTAQPNTIVGIKVPDKVRRNDLVYEIKER